MPLRRLPEDHPEVRARFPAIAEALLASASPQVRNMASIGGNLLQHTCCTYFHDPAMPCNMPPPAPAAARWAATTGCTRSSAAAPAAERAVVGARPLAMNAFKVELLRRAVRRALSRAGEMA